MVSGHEGTTKRFDRALLMAKAWCLCGPDALVNTSVFCADLRLEFGGKTKVSLSSASLKQWDMRPPNLYFNRTKVLTGVGTIDLLRFQSVYDRRPTEMCIADFKKKL